MPDDMSASLREAIEAAWDQHEGEGASASAAPPEPTQAAATADAEDADRGRDDQGRFKAKEAEPAPPATEPPDDWDEGLGFERDEWKAIPETAREKTRRLAQERKEAAERVASYEPLEKVLAPHRNALRATHGSEAVAIEQLLHVLDWARGEPAAFIQHFARERGLDLRTLGPADPAPGADPGQQPIVQNIDRLVEERVQSAIQETTVRQQISAFDSNAAYEFRHDPDVRKIMGGLLTSGAAADITTAYDIAVKAHAPTAAKLAQREAKQREEQRAQEAAAKAAAAVSARGAPGTTRTAPASTDNRDLRAVIEAAFDAEMGRV